MHNKIFKLGYYLLFILLFTILLYSAWLTYQWFQENNETEKVINEIKIVEENSDINETVNIPKNDKLEKLIEQNNDTVAYLKVNLTNIDYPVVQAINNDYYLNHSFNKKSNQAGWVFMDYRNNKNFEDDNTIIYAHNRKDKTMFGTLDNLLKTDLTKEFPLIYISTLNKQLVYQIFSVYTVNTEDYYLRINFLEDEKRQWLDTIKERNIAKVNTEVNEKDKVLTLSTCYSNDKQRLVVHAKKI